MKDNTILQGNSLIVLKDESLLPSGTIDMCMTSPPYWGLRDYGTASWEGGEIPDCKHDAAKEKSRYDYSMDTSPNQSQNKGTDAPRWKPVCPTCKAKKVDDQLGLEPTYQEYINKLCDIFDGIKRVLKPTGTCWVNLGDTYLDSELMQIPTRFAIEMANRGWLLRNTIIWHKSSVMPTSIKNRYTVDFEYLFFFSKQPDYYFNTQYEPLTEKANKYSDTNFIPESDRRIRRCVWKINPQKMKGATHFATYPEELCRSPIAAGCPVGGIVIDPFSGTGTTGRVANEQKKRYIGIELNPSSIGLAEKRMGLGKFADKFMD